MIFHSVFLLLVFRFIPEVISLSIYVYLILSLYDRQFNHHLSLPPLIVSSRRSEEFAKGKKRVI
jgi:hypothetical protein